MIVVDVLGRRLPADRAATACAATSASTSCALNPYRFFRWYVRDPPTFSSERLPRALWHGRQEECSPDLVALDRANSSTGLTVAQSGHHFCPSATTTPRGNR
jgi:hypothetical protein